jgi:hypothetical protein
MASLALGIVGGLLFGPIGFLVGSFLGNLLFPQRIDGPRLSNLKLQDSSYGMMVPIVYGTMRVPGIVIWQTDLKEHSHTSGGKGGPEVTTYSYSASFACYLCEGVMNGGIRRIWADGKLIYDINAPVDGSGAPTSLPCAVYIGDETQLPDPTMEGELGTGNVPAYRGMAYVVFDDWDLTDYGNRIPNLNFEVAMVGGTPSPIFKVAEYHQNPPHQWCYSAINSGISSDIGMQFPYVTHWVLDGSDIRVLSVMPATDINPTLPVYTYNNTSLQQNGSSQAQGPDEANVVYPFSPIAGANFGWGPIGTYVYNDLSTTPLWRNFSTGGSVVGTTTNDCVVGSGSVGYSGGHLTTALNFLFNAGVTSTDTMHNVALSQDGKTLLVMVGTTGAPDPLRSNKWYKIVNGVVTTSGTVAPNLNIIGQANTGLRFDTFNGSGKASFNANTLENNGQYLWCFGTGGDYQPVTTGPHYFGSGIATIYWIDPADNTLKWYSFGEAGIGTDPHGPNTAYPGVCCPSDGYFGVVWGASVVLFSRISGVGTVTLGEIVEDVSERSGLSPGQLDVSQLTPIVDGYLINQQQAGRDDILPLQSAWYFDAVEQAGTMVFVMRGSPPSVSIPDSDLAAQTSGSTPPPLATIKRVQEVDLPQFLDVKYVNAATAYQTADQSAQRQTVESQLKKTIELPINMTDTKAKQVANTLLFTSWIERNQFTFLTSRQYDYLEPTDVVTVRGYEIRIMQKKNIANGVLQFDGVAAVTAIWNQGPTAAGGIGYTPSVPAAQQLTNLLLLDTPLAVDTDQNIGLYAAMAGIDSSKWGGATLYESSDGGNTYSQIAAAGIASVIGSVSVVPGVFSGGNMFDESNTLTVVIGNGGGTLASMSELAVLNGANFCLAGYEFIQFKNATLIAANTYVLSGLLRGRRGTEWRMVGHLVGEPFVLFSVTDFALTFADLGQPRFYKPVTFGMTLAAAQPRTFVDTGNRQRPYSPELLAGGINGSNDIIINWTRRTRIGGAWADYTDVPVSEASELYVLQVWDSTYTICARVVTGLTSPTFTYTAAMQTTDFSRIQQTVYITVAQVGAYGLGVQARAAINGGGSHIDTPSSPVQPYNTTPPPTPPATGCSVTGTVTTFTPTWTNGVQQFFTPADFGPNDAVVVKIVVPSSPGNKVLSFAAAEYLGPPTPRTAAVALSPCGPPIQADLQTIGSLNVTWTFHSGFNPNAKNLQLQASTTYYITIQTTAVSEMIINFQLRDQV